VREDFKNGTTDSFINPYVSESLTVTYPSFHVEEHFSILDVRAAIYFDFLQTIITDVSFDSA